MLKIVEYPDSFISKGKVLLVSEIEIPLRLIAVHLELSTKKAIGHLSRILVRATCLCFRRDRSYGVTIVQDGRRKETLRIRSHLDYKAIGIIQNGLSKLSCTSKLVSYYGSQYMSARRQGNPVADA